MPIHSGAKGRTMVVALPAMVNKTLGQLGGAAGPIRIGGSLGNSDLASLGSPRPFAARPLSPQAFAITGVTRNSAGTPIGGCRVCLFMADFDTKIAETVSDGSGNFSFAATAGPYWCAAWDGAGAVAGITMETLTGV